MSKHRHLSLIVGLLVTTTAGGKAAAVVALQVLVVHLPVLQDAFGTEPLDLEAWLVCIALSTVALVVGELRKLVARHREGAIPDEMPELTIESDNGSLGIGYLLKSAGLVASTGEAFRMIKQGAVRIDGERVEDRGLTIDAGTTNVYQVGKRKFARVNLT